MCTSRAKTSHSFRKPIFSSEAEGSVGARGAFEFFATLQMSGPPHESAAKKSSDETPTAPKPVGPFGEPSAAPPGVRYGIPAFAPSRYLAFALRASLEDPRRCRSTGLPLTRRLGARRRGRRVLEERCEFFGNFVGVAAAALYSCLSRTTGWCGGVKIICGGAS